MAQPDRPRIGLLFAFDYDAMGYGRQTHQAQFDRAGFNLFTFPSNVGLPLYQPLRFAQRQAALGRRLGWAGVTSQQEHFGALAAALVAEELGLPGTAPQAILAAQHKLHARRVLQTVAPEANVEFAALDAHYGEAIPSGLTYPRFAKPIKAAFSVLAKRVNSHAELQAHTRFGRRELWVIRRLVEPFNQVCQQRLPQAGDAHRLLLEAPMPANTAQYNLDGWVYNGQCRALGMVDAIMYPRTQAFMRWDLHSQLSNAVQARALDVARRFLAAIGFTHGLFNMEFFYDPATDRLTVIEFNPRLASQFSDLYQRRTGIDPHALAIALALGKDPAQVPRTEPLGDAAASLVYRAFNPNTVPPQPSAEQRQRLAKAFPQAHLFAFPKRGYSLARDFKWLGCSCYGILHLHARDAAQLQDHATQASRILGWPTPYAGQHDSLPDRVANRPHASVDRTDFVRQTTLTSGE
jgi:hypothetical protein